MLIGLVLPVCPIVIQLQLVYQRGVTAAHDICILGYVFIVCGIGTQLIRQGGHTLAVAPTIALIVYIDAAIDHRLLHGIVPPVRVVHLTVIPIPHPCLFVRLDSALAPHTRQRECHHLYTVYLVAGIEHGKLRMSLWLAATLCFEQCVVCLAVVVSQHTGLLCGCKDAVVTQAPVKGQLAHLGHGRGTHIVALSVDIGKQIGKMPLILRTHHDIDDTTNAFGIIPGSRRRDDLYALHHLCRQTAQ